MWPPTEIPGDREGEHQVEDDEEAELGGDLLDPAPRAITTTAAISPKIAPEAPTVSELGSTISAPSEPAISETK